MPIELDIPGLTLSEGPQDLNRVRGKLDLPPAFDNKRYACKWVKKGVNTSKAQQPQHVAGTQYKADGWVPYKDPKTKTFHIRTLSDGAYVLMVRPLILQQTLQRLNGNLSRTRMEYEIKGQTIAGEANEDTGMLPHEVLARIPGLGQVGMESVRIPKNDIVAETSGPSSVNVSTKQKPKHR